MPTPFESQFFNDGDDDAGDYAFIDDALTRGKVEARGQTWALAMARTRTCCKQSKASSSSVRGQKKRPFQQEGHAGGRQAAQGRYLERAQGSCQTRRRGDCRRY